MNHAGTVRLKEGYHDMRVYSYIRKEREKTYRKPA